METKILVVTKTKGHIGKEKIPAIKISGESLKMNGFELRKLVAVKYSEGFIELQLHDSKVDLDRIRSKSGFIRVCRNTSTKAKDTPCIIVKGYWLGDMGFPIGTVAVLNIDYAKIQIRALDVEDLKNKG